MTHTRTRLLSAILFAVAGTLAGPAVAEMAVAGARTDPNVREASMVRQDVSDCTNSNVRDAEPSPPGGTVEVVRGLDGITRVKLGITASPKTTYHFFLKCIRHLGDITTQEEGEAYATFEFPTSATGNVFAFDMYPEGAPAGNKFQSVQVKF